MNNNTTTNINEDFQIRRSTEKNTVGLTATATKSRDLSRQIIKGITLGRVEYPFATLQEIGEKFGVSRQYVYKVLNHAGVPTLRAKRQRLIHCKMCDQKVEESMSKTHKGKCHGEYYFISVHCYNCNASWSMRRSVLLQKKRRGDRHIYCSRSCYFQDRFYPS